MSEYGGLVLASSLRLARVLARASSLQRLYLQGLTQIRGELQALPAKVDARPRFAAAMGKLFAQLGGETRAAAREASLEALDGVRAAFEQAGHTVLSTPLEVDYVLREGRQARESCDLQGFSTAGSQIALAGVQAWPRGGLEGALVCAQQVSVKALPVLSLLGAYHGATYAALSAVSPPGYLLRWVEPGSAMDGQVVPPGGSFQVPADLAEPEHTWGKRYKYPPRRAQDLASQLLPWAPGWGPSGWVCQDRRRVVLR